MISEFICVGWEQGRSIEKCTEFCLKIKDKSHKFFNLFNMKLLLLGKFCPQIFEFIKSVGDEYTVTQNNINNSTDILQNIDFIVSYGYKYILKKTVLDKFINKAINIHISLLPWNRGADPNLWSFLENSPKGVTIHYMDNGIDTGKILVQKKVEFSGDETLRTSYDQLIEIGNELFQKYWLDIREKKIQPQPQLISGSYHSLKDRQQYESLLINGWDTPVKNLIGKALHKE